MVLYAQDFCRPTLIDKRRLGHPVGYFLPFRRRFIKLNSRKLDRFMTDTLQKVIFVFFIAHFRYSIQTF